MASSHKWCSLRAQFERKFSSIFLLMTWTQETGLTKFAEDNELGGVTDSLESREVLENDIDNKNNG